METTLNFLPFSWLSNELHLTRILAFPKLQKRFYLCHRVRVCVCFFNKKLIPQIFVPGLWHKYPILMVILLISYFHTMLLVIVHIGIATPISPNPPWRIRSLRTNFSKQNSTTMSNNIGSMIYQNIFVLPELLNLNLNGMSTTSSLSLFRFCFFCFL